MFLNNPAFVFSLMMIVALLCQWLAWRIRIPAILFLLLTGLFVGLFTPFDPDAIMGEHLMTFVSLSVAIILFEGSLTLRREEISELGTVVRRMVTVGALITWISIAVATHWILEFSIAISALFGALVVVTGPTVIAPILRSVRPTRQVANILRWEGIVIDPIGALFAVVTYEFILASTHGNAIAYTLQLFGSTILLGIATGVGGGAALGLLLRKNLVPEYLHGLLAISGVLFIFSLSNSVLHESGLLAVTVMGIWLANVKGVEIHHILNFKENLSVLLISVLFILLAARVDISAMIDLGWKAILIILVIQFVARPLKVLVSTWGVEMSWQEKALLSWIAPRGIVAAAISAIFAEKLAEAGFEEAPMLVSMTFFVILCTVILQSLTARKLAVFLDVAELEPHGFLFTSANPVARKLAQELQKFDVRCLLCDSNWDNISQARMAGLETYYGNPTSEDADVYLDLNGIGNLLAVSTNRDVSLASAMHFRSDLGSQGIYCLSMGDSQKSEKHQFSESLLGATLFDKSMTYGKLASLISKGHQIKITTLSDEFDWKAYQEKNAGRVTALFYRTPKGKVLPFAENQKIKPEIGGKVMGLFAPEQEEQQG